jgi:hypothetical protein
MMQEAIITHARYYPNICLGGLRNTTKMIREYNWHSSRDSNLRYMG